jgi:hypothetical protein
MPLQKLQFRPGVNREGTTLSNEGGWFESEKARWRSGYPEKIGGWVRDTGTANATLKPSTGAIWGICRALWNWLNLTGYNLLAAGTNLKYYLQNTVGGSFYDITPIRTTTTAGEVTFAATNGSTTITVTDNAHGAQAGDFVTFSGAVSLGGTITAAVLNSEYQVASITSNNVYTITTTVTATASDTGNGGASVVGAYQITTGSDVFTFGTGWGAGGWSGLTTGYTSTGWGSPAPAGLGLGIQLRLWSQSNYGEDLIFNPRGGAMYYWANNASPNVYDRGQIIKAGTGITTKNGTITPDSTCPSVANFVMVSDASRFVFAFGTNDPSGATTGGTTTQNPLLIRWSDQQAVGTWSPSITNQAGSITLSHGSTIVAAIQTRQEILVLTDSAIYSMQYLGAPYVWSTQLLGDNISIVSPNAMATVNNVTYWMGADKFYMYSGRVETLPCALRSYIYNDINLSQAFQFFSGTNEGFNEVWWFYCSANSNTVDKYVIYNHLERTWYYGTFDGTTVRPRTAWLDSPLRPEPTAAIANGTNATVVYHETGVDNNETGTPVPIESWVQSSDFDIGDGHNFGFVWRLIPDITFDGSFANQPSADFTVRPRQFPGSNYGATDSPTVASNQNYAGVRTYNVQEFTEQVYVRIRGRQMAFKVSSNDLGVQWQLGVPRIDVRPDGRR